VQLESVLVNEGAVHSSAQVLLVEVSKLFVEVDVLLRQLHNFQDWLQINSPLTNRLLL
jgi:hypothetical protein